MHGYCKAHYTPRPRTRRDKRTTTQQGYNYRWRKVRPMILERDNHTCVFCGKSPANIIHHLDRQVDNMSPDNLLTLCFDCHEREHGRKY